VGDVLAAAVTRTAALRAPGPEIEIITEVSCRNSAHAANPWLRELPDPLTRVSWSGCARVAPALARDLGIADGTVVDVAVGGAVVTLPAIVLPGQHPDVVAVPAGYGTWDEARPHDVDATQANAARPLLGSAVAAVGIGWRGASTTLENTGRASVVPRIQIHAQTEGRPIVHQVGAHDEAVHLPHHPEADMWPERAETSPQWGMVIDLDACVGCSGCVVACQAENNIPVVGAEQMAHHRDMYWLRIDRYFVGDADDPDVLFEPMLCAQCDHAPCETVCPVAATVQSSDGLNQQIYNRCVGTRYCANNCPYKVRRFNWFKFEPTDPIERLVLNPDVVVRSRGVMEKCTFCVQRIQSARIDARRDGRPAFEVQTACQQSCPAQAIHFGDATNREGAVARLGAKPRAFQVLAELGIKPSLTYMARVRTRDDLQDHEDVAGTPAASEHGAGAP
jgi:molybdopterin-containing oxidoreductase family iron-sulfur binding subunit